MTNFLKFLQKYHPSTKANVVKDSTLMEYCHSVSEKGSQRERDVYLVLVSGLNELK